MDGSAAATLFKIKNLNEDLSDCVPASGTDLRSPNVNHLSIAEERKYRKKYTELKRKVKDLENGNDEMVLRLENVKKHISRLKAEKRILLDYLERAFEEKEQAENPVPPLIRDGIEIPPISLNLESRAIEQMSETIHEQTRAMLLNNRKIKSTNYASNGYHSTARSTANDADEAYQRYSKTNDPEAPIETPKSTRSNSAAIEFSIAPKQSSTDVDVEPPAAKKPKLQAPKVDSTCRKSTTPFNIFTSTMRAEYKKMYPELSAREILKVLSRAWDELTDEERKPHIDAAKDKQSTKAKSTSPSKAKIAKATRVDNVVIPQPIKEANQQIAPQVEFSQQDVQGPNGRKHSIYPPPPMPRQQPQSRDDLYYSSRSENLVNATTRTSVSIPPTPTFSKQRSISPTATNEPSYPPTAQRAYETDNTTEFPLHDGMDTQRHDDPSSLPSIPAVLQDPLPREYSRTAGAMYKDGKAFDMQGDLRSHLPNSRTLSYNSIDRYPNRFVGPGGLKAGSVAAMLYRGEDSNYASRASDVEPGTSAYAMLSRESTSGRYSRPAGSSGNHGFGKNESSMYPHYATAYHELEQRYDSYARYTPYPLSAPSNMANLQSAQASPNLSNRTIPQYERYADHEHKYSYYAPTSVPPHSAGYSNRNSNNATPTGSSAGSGFTGAPYFENSQMAHSPAWVSSPRSVSYPDEAARPQDE